LTILYCSTDRRCRAGAPVKYLSHNASFQTWEKSAPSISGTKQLGSTFFCSGTQLIRLSGVRSYETD
jgi:hypothetical protein